MGRDHEWAGTEPSLAEVLNDPLVQLLMRRDRLEPAEVRRVIDAARRRMTAPLGAGPRGGGPVGPAAAASESHPLTRPSAADTAEA